jgi:Mn-dependent DtxR family transcriptional regulator
MDKLSFTLESYLDSIYELSVCKGAARLTDIAQMMGVTKSTANAAVAALAERKLILNERYQRIRLTESGAVMAQGIAKKHEVIRRFFSEILKIDKETADVDACAIEHIISGAAVDAMQSYLTRACRARSGFCRHHSF